MQIIFGKAHPPKQRWPQVVSYYGIRACMHSFIVLDLKELPLLRENNIH